MFQQQQKKPQYWIGCLVLCTGSSMSVSHLQDRVDFVGGSQPLVSLLPVARDSGEQRACLVLDAPLVDEELLHAAVDRVHEEIGHPHSASQSIVLGSIYVCVCVSLIVGNLHNRNQGNL